MDFNGPMTRARAKKLKESMQALVSTTYEGIDRARIEAELEQDKTIHYVLIQVLEPSEVKLGASSEE